MEEKRKMVIDKGITAHIIRDDEVQFYIETQKSPPDDV